MTKVLSIQTIKTALHTTTVMVLSRSGRLYQQQLHTNQGVLTKGKWERVFIPGPKKKHL